MTGVQTCALPISPLLGRYTRPKAGIGTTLTDQTTDPPRRVRVDGVTEAPIPWPYHQLPGGKISLVLCGDLVRAVRTESGQAVAAWWGVSRWVVQRWRRTLGVGRMTPGTQAVWRRAGAAKLDAARRAKARRMKQR